MGALGPRGGLSFCGFERLAAHCLRNLVGSVALPAAVCGSATMIDCRPELLTLDMFVDGVLGSKPLLAAFVGYIMLYCVSGDV